MTHPPCLYVFSNETGHAQLASVVAGLPGLLDVILGRQHELVAADDELDVGGVGHGADVTVHLVEAVRAVVALPRTDYPAHVRR